jgi:hypothetical protein
MNTFVRVDDEALINVLQKARQRLVFIAPGVRKVVAVALAKAMDTVPSDFVHLVLDVDAEICRLGYGSTAGLELLQNAAAMHELTVNHHPGIRIGLVIADDTTLIYSPTAELIEGGSKQPDKPNAIALRGELPSQLANACAVGEEKHATLEVGKDPINLAAVELVKRDLQERPPKPFNVSRIERVFSSMLHYVEFEIEHYKLTTRALHLDAELFGVRNEEVIRRLTSRYHLFAETDSLTVEIPFIGDDGSPDTKNSKVKFGPLSIDRERNRIKKEFVIEAGRKQSLILRRDVAGFERQINRLKAMIKAYRQAVQAEIKRRTEEIVGELLAGLTESLKANPPERWRSRYLKPKPDDADVKRLFEEDIKEEVERVRTDFNPEIFVAYKDVTYQTFKDEKFRKLIEDRFGKEAIDRIFSEHDAAPEQDGEGHSTGADHV